MAVWNRTPERAAALAAEFGVRHAVDAPSRPACWSTPLGLGMRGEDLPGQLGLDALEPELVADLVYGGGRTALCRWAERRGARVVDGLEMLLRQGARSLEGWTGRQRARSM